MAIKVMEGLAPGWFIPLTEKESDRPAQFHIEPMDGLEYLQVIQDGSIRFDDDGGMEFSVSESGRAKILSKVLGWRNIDGANGGNLAFSQKNLRTLPTAILAEVCQEVLRVSNLAQESEKKSSSQLKSSTENETSIATDANGEGTATPVTPPQQSNG